MTSARSRVYNFIMTDELFLRYSAISLFKDTAEAISPLAALIVADGAEKRLRAAADVFRRVADAEARSTGEWIDGLLLVDDNPFSRAAAEGKRIPPHIKAQAEKELLTFKQMSLLRTDRFFDGELLNVAPAFISGGMESTYEKVAAFYSANGCGKLAASDAFVYTDKGFSAVVGENVHLSDLVNYGEEKSEVVKNTENFIAGLPAFHTLLYGDRGTGKSTTVRAIGREYAGRLKMIELDSGRLDLLPELCKELSGLKQKFIIFIDDLSFDENDGRAEGFKAALEGSLDACSSKNALIYCTSNRRHLFKETDRPDLRNRNDEMQAELALFDRFGLVVTYINPNKSEFLDIFRQILAARGIKWRDEYAQIAELAALKKGGRTPRAAKQIADLIQATYAELK